MVAGLHTVTAAMPAAAGQLGTHASSQRVALIPQAGPVPAQGPNGIMPTSSYVAGRPSESFARFSFSNLAINQITPAQLANFDTVALIQVPASILSSTARMALAQFVAGGGKLIIHDADETKGNDYSWLLGGAYSTGVGAGCNNCGSASGQATITTNNGIVSANPADPSYVNLAELYHFTDQGDANLIVSTDPHWFTLVTGTNGAGDTGAQVAYAQSGGGLVIYNGFDTDFIKTRATDPWRCNDAATGFSCPPPPAAQPTVDWLAQMWYSELAETWGSSGQTGGNLPTTIPVTVVGTPVPPTTVGLPKPGRRCVARKRIFVRLSRLAHLRHRTVVEVVVYINRKQVLRERRPFRDRSVKVPRRGAYTVTVVAVTKRGYHLVVKQRYRGC
jgi:hypothetical protein